MKRLLNIAILAVFLLSCTPKRYQDISNSVASQELPVPHGEFESVAWFDENHIAFVYRLDEPISTNIEKNFRIGVFEISTGITKDLPLIPSSSDCPSSRSKISNLTRLPNGSLGFIFSCGSGEYSLYILDPVSNETVKRQTYFGFIAKDFSFSPDMSQLVQENGNGGGLSETLLLVSPDNTIKELLPDFQRARSPTWSPDGKTIAFAGTQNNPNNSENTTLKDIESLFLYPWDIYLMNADGSNPRILLPLVGTIYGLKWSPTNKNLLLFGGISFENVAGVWLLDVSTMSVTRIWDKNTNFDWSPDGSKIVLLDDIAEAWWKKIRVIDISNSTK